MSKILFLPLDERPCNYNYPTMMSEKCDDIEFVFPPKNLLGDKKTPADTEVLAKWLRENFSGCDYAVISVDMLMYGGIVPSRLHFLSEEECLKRLGILKELHESFPEVHIFAFNLIMRAPAYSSAEEEPDYYGECGAELCRLGVLRDKMSLGIADDNEKKELETLEVSVPSDAVNDFTSRRKINHIVNMEIVSYVKQNILDFLVIPMDDCAPYGWAAAERREIRKIVMDQALSRRVYSYSGADEVGDILLARAVNQSRNLKPSIYVCSSCVYGLLVTPKFEDRPLGENIKWQISSAGGRTALSPEDADFILMVNAPTAGGDRMGFGDHTPDDLDASYGNCRCLPDFASKLAVWGKKKPVIFADLALSNGADNECMELLRQEDLLHDLYSYSGWNTDANAVGTCIAQGMICAGNSKKSALFTTHRLIEDWLYMSGVRQEAAAYVKENDLHFDRGEEEKQIADYVIEKLTAAVNNVNLPVRTKIRSVSFPWHRLFEAEILIDEI